MQPTIVGSNQKDPTIACNIAPLHQGEKNKWGGGGGAIVGHDSKVKKCSLSTHNKRAPAGRTSAQHSGGRSQEPQNVATRKGGEGESKSFHAGAEHWTMRRADAPVGGDTLQLSAKFLFKIGII